MSLEQYNSLMSNLLNQKHTLAKLRAELEGRRGRICQCCKGFGHLAQNCRSRDEKEERGVTPQNKYEVLSSRVMQCGVGEKTIRRQEMVEVECFKCGEKGHKCREYPLWKGKKLRVVEEVVHVAMPQKVQQKEWRRSPVHILQWKCYESPKKEQVSHAFKH